MKALIPAAGMGTRFMPYTKTLPKEMIMVINKPVIQYVVEEGLASGADEVVIINSPEKKVIEEYFSPDAAVEEKLRAAGKTAYADEVAHAGSLPVGYVYQTEPKGLGHAVYMAADAIGGEPFFVLLGDVIVLDNAMCVRMKQISEEHGGASVIAVVPVPDDQVSRFGIIGGREVGNNVWKVERLVEKPKLEDAPSRLAIFGRYLLSPAIMDILRITKPGVGGEIQLTDAMVELLKTEEMYAYVIDPSDGYDVGTVETWLDANAKLAKRLGK